MTAISPPPRAQAILDCSEVNEGFYVKCGYKRAGLQMAHYYGNAHDKGVPACAPAPAPDGASAL